LPNETLHTNERASTLVGGAPAWGQVRPEDRSVLGWGLTWSGVGHVAAVLGLIGWAMTLPADADFERPLTPVPHVTHPMNVQFVMDKGSPTATADKTEPTPQAAEPIPDPPQEVAEAKPLKKKKVRKKRRAKRVAANHQAVAPPIVAEDAPPAPVIADTEATDTAKTATPSPSPARPAVVAVNKRGNLGQEAHVDRRGALRGYLKAITRNVHREYSYPRSAQRARLEGRAVVTITIDAQGNVTGVKLAETSGHSVLDDAALAAARSLMRLPAAPPELHWTERSVRVPFLYSLTG